MGAVKRKKYWINIRTQGPFFLRIAAIWAGGILLLCLILHYLADEELGRSFYSVHLRLRNTWQILLPAVVVSSGISFLLAMVGTFLVTMRESHRLGGPAFKFHRLFNQLAAGYLDTDFKFRKGDLLVDLGEDYRAALAANRQRIARVQDLSRKIEWKVGLLREQIGTDRLSGEQESLLLESASLASELSRAAAAFHVGTP